MKILITLVILIVVLGEIMGQANETYKACQSVMTCFQDAEDEIDKCLSILIGERNLGTDAPKPKISPEKSNDCMTPIKDKIKQKKILDQERVQNFKVCLDEKITLGTEDVDPRKYRYCATVTGRYQNKTAEATNKRVRRQLQPVEQVGLPQLPSKDPEPILGEPKNSTAGGGLEQPISALANSSIVEITKKPHETTLVGIVTSETTAQSTLSTASVSGETIATRTSPTGSTLGTLGSTGSTLGQTASSTQKLETLQQQLSSLNSQPALTSTVEQGQTLSGLIQSQQQTKVEKTLETTLLTSQKPLDLTASSQIQLTQSSGTLQQQQSTLVQEQSAGQRLTTPTGQGGQYLSTTESEYEESGAGSSEIHGKSAEVLSTSKSESLPTTASSSISETSTTTIGINNSASTNNLIVDALNLTNNVSEPVGPPLEESNKTSSLTSEAATPGIPTAPGGAPAPRSPAHRAQKPIGAADIDAGTADQDNTQRVRVEQLRETRKRLSEFKGCMARARIKREECKPLVRCCPDTAMCHLNYESSELHNRVHKLESEIVQGRQECLNLKKSATNKDEHAPDALDQIDAEELISDDSVVSQAIF